MHILSAYLVFGENETELERMEPAHQLNALIDLAESLGIEVRRAPAREESGGRPGGSFVRLRGKSILFLDPCASWNDQISVAAMGLRGQKELDDIFIPPEIRQLIETATQ